MIWNFYYIILFYTLLSFVCITKNEKNYSSYRLFELNGPVKDIHEVINYITNIDGHTAYELTANKAQVLLRPDLVATFTSAVRQTRLQMLSPIRDFSLLLKTETKKTLRKKEFSWDAYYDIDDINEFMISTSQKFRQWTKLVYAGKSFEGRKIVGIKILTKLSSSSKKKKPVVFVEAGIHAREWIVPATTTYLINQLLTSDNPDIAMLRDNFEWHIFPVVNPDGYHYSYTVDRMWRKTRSKSNNSECYGADGNRNWDYHFGAHGGSNDPCNYQIYCGSKPFSEIETKSLSRYILRIKRIFAYFSYHSYAWCILVPHSDTKEHIQNYTNLIQLAKRASVLAQPYLGRHYQCGTAAEIIHPISGTSMDWVYLIKKPPLCFTFELRGRSFLWPANKIKELSEEVMIMLIGLFEEARRLGYYKNISVIKEESNQ